MPPHDRAPYQLDFDLPNVAAECAPFESNTPERLKCYVADDETAIRDMLGAALDKEQVDFRGFGAATDAIEVTIADRPHLLFLDLALDGSDAVDVIRGLGAHAFRGAIQLMSGRDHELLDQVKRIGEQHGLKMLEPLQKPFKISQFRAIVERCRADLFDQPREVAVAAVAANDHPSFVSPLTLDEVLRHDWLEFWYQPKVDLKRQCIVGAELLARCIHPELGLVLPGSFIPDAAPTAMHQLTVRALTTALNDWPAFAEAGFPLKLSINASIADLMTVPFHAEVRANRPRRDNWPGLIVEVTEDQAMRDISLLQEIAVQLRIQNIVLALDDFGYGYTHLGRLKEIPFAELKLDRHLVSNCDDDPNSMLLCRTAIDLAHQFGAVAVAEGIEKRSELQALTALGCEIGQGFLFAQAMPQQRLIALLQAAQPANTAVRKRA